MTIITTVVKAHLNEKMGSQAKRIGLGGLLEDIENSVVLGVSAGTITATELASSAVTAAKLASDAVETAKIKNEAVTTAKIADDQITTAKILDANVTADKLASNAVTTAKVAANAITEAKIAGFDATTLNVKRCLLGIFNATAGKDIGSYSIACALPSKAIVTKVDYEVITTFTSATDAATIALTLQTAGDVVAATAIETAGDAWDAAAPAATIIDGSVDEYIKCTAARTLTATVAVEALTAGVMRVYAEYVQSV
jgi:hypothetical protein